MEKLKNVKIVFIDIDGTLTNGKRRVTLTTKKSIKRITKKGIKVVITSGRNYLYSTNMSKKANASPIVISSDGSIIYDYKNDKIMYKNYIDIEKLEKIYDFAEEHKIGIILNSTNHSYCNKYGMSIKGYKTTFLPKELLEKHSICQIVLIRNIRNNLDEIMKLMKKANLQISYFSRSFYNKSHGDASIDLVNQNVSKGESIKFLLKKLNIKKKESVCIGDYNNDLDMFDACGFKVAMGNASKEIKEKADYITLSNEKNGVAYFLNNFI